MPTQKTLREILEDVGMSYGACHMKELNDKVINSAISEIKSLIKEKLPRKKELIRCPHGEIYGCESCAEQNKSRIIYNSALTEIEKIVEALTNLREEIEKLVLEIEDNRDKFCNATISHQIYQEKKTQVAEQILQVFEEVLPKEIELLIRPGKPKNSRYNKKVEGFNSCLAQIREAINEK